MRPYGLLRRSWTRKRGHHCDSYCGGACYNLLREQWRPKPAGDAIYVSEPRPGLGGVHGFRKWASSRLCHCHRIAARLALPPRISHKTRSPIWKLRAHPTPYTSEGFAFSHVVHVATRVTSSTARGGGIKRSLPFCMIPRCHVCKLR
jgi:hypothetical protein